MMRGLAFLEKCTDSRRQNKIDSRASADEEQNITDNQQKLDIASFNGACYALSFNTKKWVSLLVKKSEFQDFVTDNGAL